MRIQIGDRDLLHLAAGLCLTAALTHALSVPEHYTEFWGYGLVFILIGVIQGAYGMLLLLSPWKQNANSNAKTERLDRAFYLFGAAATGAAVFLFIFTRAIGIPFFGPAAWEIEPITFIGVVTQVIELALLVTLVTLAQRTRTEPAEVPTEN